jgi:hypothetical protein
MGENKKPKHERVPVGPGLLKRLMTRVAEAVPIELPTTTAEWWENHGNSDHLAEAVRDGVYHPPTVGNVLENWRRFYRVFFGISLPQKPLIGLEGYPLCDNLADGWVLCTSEPWWRDWRDFNTHVLYPLCHPTSKFPPPRDSIRTVQSNPKFPSQVRAFRWYWIRLKPYNEVTGDVPTSPVGRIKVEEFRDVGKLTFSELLVQQLFLYWRGRPLSNQWLPACGSRTADNKVPALRWVNGWLDYRQTQHWLGMDNQTVNQVLALEE